MENDPIGEFETPSPGTQLIAFVKYRDIEQALAKADPTNKPDRVLDGLMIPLVVSHVLRAEE